MMGMQSSVAAIRRGRLQAHFVTTSGHHRIRGYGLTDPSRGRLVPAMRPAGDQGSRTLGLGARGAVPYAVQRRPLSQVRRGQPMTWSRPAFTARLDGVSPTAAWRD
jgi:hypothetical protein